MSEIEMLCMANSWKHQERCIAGLLTDGSWIRPVSNPDGGAITMGQCKTSEGRSVRPLDVIRLVVERPSPLPHQPENRLIANQPWQFLRRREAHEIADFLTNCEYQQSSIFGTKTRKVSWEQIQGKRVEESLALIRAARPKFYWKDRGPAKSRQHRVLFVHDGTEYDLPVTFDLGTGEDGRQSSWDWWLTISLSGPLALQGNDCYKLVAGAIKIPGI